MIVTDKNNDEFFDSLKLDLFKSTIYRSEFSGHIGVIENPDAQKLYVLRGIEIQSPYGCKDGHLLIGGNERKFNYNPNTV